MPQLELTELEAKVAWLMLDRRPLWFSPELEEAQQSLWDKVYRAYRGMPAKSA